jgi:hypothetical protein
MALSNLVRRKSGMIQATLKTVQSSPSTSLRRNRTWLPCGAWAASSGAVIPQVVVLDAAHAVRVPGVDEDEMDQRVDTDMVEG